MLGRAPAIKRKRAQHKPAQPFVQGRYKLLNTLGCLAFARVTRVLARNKGSHNYNRGVHGFERDTRFLSGYTGYATILGIDGARQRVQLLADQAKEHLAIFREKANILLQSVDFVLDRTH